MTLGKFTAATVCILDILQGQCNKVVDFFIIQFHFSLWFSRFVIFVLSKTHTDIRNFMYTHRFNQGHCKHFLVYIPSWWKNQPSLVRGGRGVHAQPPFILSTITYKVVVYAPAKRADTLPLFLLYPYMYSVLLKIPQWQTGIRGVGVTGCRWHWRLIFCRGGTTWMGNLKCRDGVPRRLYFPALQ